MKLHPVLGARTVRRLAIAALAVSALAVPATAGAGAEHIVISIVNAHPLLEFDDPCTGIPVHGIATENGVVHITELGDRGHHVHGRANGTVALLDDNDEPVGTWTYRVTFGDQFPPEAQGAAHFVAIGPLAYANGSTATVHVHGRTVFAKGDTIKHDFSNSSCSRLEK